MASAEVEMKFGSVSATYSNAMNEGLKLQENVFSGEYERDNKFYFWARQLTGFLDEKSVIFAGYADGKFERLQLFNVIKELKDIDYFEAVVSVNLLPQPNFVKITFDSVSMVEIFADTVSNIGEIPIKVVNMSDFPNTVYISISNLPPELIEQIVFPMLLQWGTPVRLIQNYIPKVSGGKVQVGSSKIEFTLAANKTIFDIPYFVRVHGFKVYLNIKGKPKVCFRCNSVSHLVTDCPLKFCGVCRSLKVVQHFCQVTYASVAKVEGRVVLAPLERDDLLAEEVASAEGPDLKGVSSLLKPDKVSVVVEEDKSEECDMDIMSVGNCDDRNEMKIGSTAKSSAGRMRTRSLSASNERRSFSSNRTFVVKSAEQSKSFAKRKIKPKKGDGGDAGQNKKKKESNGSSSAKRLVVSNNSGGKKEKPKISDGVMLHAGTDSVLSGEKQHGGQRDVCSTSIVDT